MPMRLRSNWFDIYGYEKAIDKASRFMNKPENGLS